MGRGKWGFRDFSIAHRNAPGDLYGTTGRYGEVLADGNAKRCHSMGSSGLAQGSGEPMSESPETIEDLSAEGASGQTQPVKIGL